MQICVFCVHTPEGHDLLWATRTLLPVGNLTVTAHEPVMSSSNDPLDLIWETEVIRVMEGRSSHYMGMLPDDDRPRAGTRNDAENRRAWSEAVPPRPRASPASAAIPSTSVLIVIMHLAELIFLPVSSGSCPFSHAGSHIVASTYITKVNVCSRYCLLNSIGDKTICCKYIALMFACRKVKKDIRMYVYT